MDQLINNFITMLPTFGIIILLLAMVFSLGKGADILVEQAVKLSKLWGVPQIIIGATIISLGTTLPEVTVSVAASLSSQTDMSLGNATGSVICNSSLILGVALVIKKSKFNKNDVKFNSLFLLFVSILLILISIPFTNIKSLHGHISYIWSFVLLFLLAYFLYYNVKHSRNNKEENSSSEKEDINLFTTLLMLVLSITIVILSSKILLPSAVEIATRASIPSSIIAATLVALGTSLPELSTSIKAARSGNTGIAIGNVIGANILNIVFVVGGSLVVNPSGLNVSKDFFILTYPVMLFVVLVLSIILNRKSQQTNRFDGLILLLIYVSYIITSYLIT